MKIIVAATPNEARQEILKYLRWCRDREARLEVDEKRSVYRSRRRAARVALDGVIADISEAFIVGPSATDDLNPAIISAT